MKLTEAELKAIGNETWADCRTPVAKFLKADRQRQQLLAHIRTPEPVNGSNNETERDGSDVSGLGEGNDGTTADDSAAQDGATPGEDESNVEQV